MGITDFRYSLRKLPFLYMCGSLMKIMTDNRLHLLQKFNHYHFFLTAFGKRNLFATLPRSGTNYIDLLLDVAYDLSKGGNGHYYYEGISWIRNYRLMLQIDWRSVPYKNKIINTSHPFIFHTHLPYNDIVSMQKKNMKTVVLVRDIYAQMTSRLFQTGFGIERQDDFIDNRYFLSVIDFLNDWGRQVKRRENCSFVRYEDIVKKPLETLRYLSNTWELYIDDKFFLRAIDLCKRDIMLNKVPKADRDRNPRVAVRQYKFEEVFTRNNKQKINKIIKNKLRYDFGYKYYSE